MGKDPAFLFYPNDYLGGTMGMTLEEKGAYMELLMLQFNRGHMTKDMIGQTIGHLWVNIEVKFEVDDQGRYFNRRLEEEQLKRRKFVESRSNNRSGKNQYSKSSKKDGGHMTSHMENRNENINTIKENREKYLAWAAEVDDPDYQKFVDTLMGKNNLECELKACIKLKPLSYTQFVKIRHMAKEHNQSLVKILENMEDWKDLRKRKIMYNVMRTFITPRS